MQSNKSNGFSKERFPDLNGDSFDCGICEKVCNIPKECMKCGNMYCQGCIQVWLKSNKSCPTGCSDAVSNIRDITGALFKIYKNLELKCSIPNCKRIVRICELEEHERDCELPDCKYYQHCKKKVNINDFKGEGVCSIECKLLTKVINCKGDWKSLLTDIKQLHRDLKANKQASDVLKGQNLKPVIFKWDRNASGQNIKVSSDGYGVELKENAYMFRSIVSDQGFYQGVHYWEIQAHPSTENELKIGVVTQKNFNYNSSFSDYPFGYAYYGLGQLRHGSNSVGQKFGGVFKKQGILGVCLDMNEGTLAYSLNGQYWGIAFKDQKLKQGPIYPALSMLHTAACTVLPGKPLPQIFR